MTRKNVGKSCLLLTVLALSACANVQPWQRGNLAKPGMQFEPDPMLSAYRQHVEVSKEAAAGGATLGGGGCGCN